MHRLKSIHTKDTWYAFSYADVEYAKKKWNEQYYGIDGYVYADEQPNTVPLHHLKSTTHKRHLVHQQLCDRRVCQS